MAEGKRPETKYAWLVLSLLFAAALLNYMDRTVLAVVMPQVRRDLSLSNAQYGFAVNAFLLFYMVTYPVGGFAADRLGVRRMFLFNVLSWSVAGMLQALSRGFFSLCAFRGLLGVAEGPFPATAMRGLADWFPSATRAKPISVLFCGISLGSMVAPPLVAAITLAYGWRAAFLFTGALGFLLVPPWLLLQRRIALVFGSRDPTPARPIDAAALGDFEDVLSVREVVRRRKYLFVLVARSLTDATWFFFLFWMAGYFQESRGFELAKVGWLLWIPFLFADFGALAGSWISSALIRKGLGVDRSRKSVMTVSALLVLSTVGAAYVPSSLVSLGLLSVALLGLQSWASNLHTVITEISPGKHVATLFAITGTVGTLLGAISQPLIGRAVDTVGYEPVFVAAGLAMTLALSFLLAAGKIELIRREPRGFGSN